MKKIVSIVLFPVFLSGCASVVSDKTQLIKVEVLDRDGVSVKDVKCDVRNDNGMYVVETPQHVMIRKSGDDLSITCNHEKHGQAKGVLTSRVGAAVFGNILLGGIVGAVVDSASGVAYSYPDWVQLEFGKLLTFDRNDYKNSNTPTPAGSRFSNESQEKAKPAVESDVPAPESNAVETKANQAS